MDVANIHIHLHMTSHISSFCYVSSSQKTKHSHSSIWYIIGLKWHVIFHFQYNLLQVKTYLILVILVCTLLIGVGLPMFNLFSFVSILLKFISCCCFCNHAVMHLFSFSLKIQFYLHFFRWRRCFMRLTTLSSAVFRACRKSSSTTSTALRCMDMTSCLMMSSNREWKAAFW